MKNLILITLPILLISQIVFGQNEKPITKGNFITGGSFSFNTEESKIYYPASLIMPRQEETDDTRTFETDFYFGYFVINHLTVGLKTNIKTSNTIQSWIIGTSSNKIIYNDISFGPLIRYYTNPGIFFEGSAAFGFIKNVNFNNSANWKNNSITGGVGYSLFIAKSVALEPEIKYTHTNWPKYVDEGSKETIDGLNFSLGCQIYLDFNKQVQNDK